MDPFLLKLEQIHSYFPHCSTIHDPPNWEEMLCEWKELFFWWVWSRATRLLSRWRGFLWTGRLKWSVSAFWLFSTDRAVWLDSETLKVVLVWWALDAQLTFRSSPTEKQGQQRVALSSHLLSSIPSLGSAWKKWALDSATPRSYRETSSGVLPVCVSLCGLCRRVGQACALFLMHVCASESVVPWYRDVICGLFSCQAAEALPTVMCLSTKIQSCLRCLLQYWWYRKYRQTWNGNGIYYFSCVWILLFYIQLHTVLLTKVCPLVTNSASCQCENLAL